jgi:hypothetical protein
MKVAKINTKKIKIKRFEGCRATVMETLVLETEEFDLLIKEFHHNGFNGSHLNGLRLSLQITPKKYGTNLIIPKIVGKSSKVLTFGIYNEKDYKSKNRGENAN